MTRGRASLAAAEADPAESPQTPTNDAHEADPESEDVTLIYRGNADIFERGSLRIRPGTPVTVPNDVAEELLTFPHEAFEVVVSQE